MPRPFSALSPIEQRLYSDLAVRPLDTDTPGILADAVEDQDEKQRTALLRQQARLPLLELLRGAALTEEESAQVAGRVRDLLTSQPAASGQAVEERELASSLGAPRGNAMLTLLDPEGNLDTERLRQQYDFQVTMLASLDLLIQQEGRLGITGITGRFHPLPSLQGIQSRLDTPALRTKIEQGFNSLLLVPFALPLSRLLEALGRDLCRNEHLLQPHGGLDRDEPVWLGHGLLNDRSPDEDGRLVYFPRRFATDHGGQTKAALLAADPTAGWQALLVEGAMTSLPLVGRGQIIAGRRQMECGRTPQQYLQSLPKDEVDWTPETYAIAFCTQLERTGCPLDDASCTYLLGAYQSDHGYVPAAYWDPWCHRALLAGYYSDGVHLCAGSRAAVRVV